MGEFFWSEAEDATPCVVADEIEFEEWCEGIRRENSPEIRILRDLFSFPYKNNV